MPSTNRMLSILGLFELSRPIITPEWLMGTLNASRASIYRDLAQLTSAGMLERVADRGYVLGPMVVELDRQIRLGDPLLDAAAQLLGQLASDTGGAVLLCRLHGYKVMCIEQINAQQPALTVSYERGRAMPLYRGATSKIVLANLRPAQLKQLWAAERPAMVAAGLPDDFAQLCTLLAQLRDAGYCFIEGELDAEAAGLAVALKDGEHLLGSLSVVIPAARLTATLRKTTLKRLQSAAGRIEARLLDQRQKARAHKKTATPS